MYNKYSDDELIEAYTTMMDYSGKISNDMVNAIEKEEEWFVFLN